MKICKYKYYINNHKPRKTYEFKLYLSNKYFLYYKIDKKI